MADAYFSAVASLLHLDGANGATSIVDQKGKTWSTLGGAALSTAQSKFGTASLALNGSSQSIATADHADFAFGNGDFTIEGFFRPSSMPAFSAILCIKDSSANTTVGFSPFRIDVDSAGTLYAFLSYAGSAWDVSLTSAAGLVSANSWYHLALVRSGTSVMLFLDGVQRASGSIGTNSLWSNAHDVILGGKTHNATSLRLTGYLDEWRITKGVARYTSNFTAPAEAFPDFGPGAELAASVAAVAIAQASLTSGIALGGSAASVAAASGTLLTAIQLAATLSASSTASASLSEAAGAELAGTAQAQSNCIGALSTGIALSAHITAQALAQARFWEPAALDIPDAFLFYVMTQPMEYAVQTSRQEDAVLLPGTDLTIEAVDELRVLEAVR